MLPIFRRSARISRCVAALLLSAGWVAPLAVPHSVEDDRTCLVVARASDDKVSRITAPADIERPEHCAVCHALRSFGNARVVKSRIAFHATLERFVSPADELCRRPPVFDRRPARAPPV